MVNIQKSGDSAIKFTFTDNDRYLYDGEITVPLNSLILVLDESDMVVIKKVDGDVFLTFLIDNTNFSTKAELEEWFKENACGSTGGGGVTSGEVQTMIDESISGKADTSDVQNVASDVATVSGDVSTLSGSVDSNHNAITALNGDVQTLSGDVANKADTTAVTASINAAVSGKMDTSAFNTYSASTDARLSEDEEVTSAALNELNDALDDKADTTAVTESINAAVSGKADTSAVTASITAAVSGKQDTLIAGTNITISGNVISAEGGGLPESAFTTYTASTDARLAEDEEVTAAALNSLNDALSGKQDTLSAGTNITISGNVISAEGGGATYTAGRGIDIDSGNTISFSLPISAGTGQYSVIEGQGTSAMTSCDHAEGKDTYAKGGSGYPAHAEGERTSAMTYSAHAEGRLTKANGECSHAEGKGTETSGEAAHAEGGWTKAVGNFSHAEGVSTSAMTYTSHAEGSSTIAKNESEHASGKHNVSNTGSTSSGNTLFSVGNGYSTAHTHNAIEIRQNGDFYFADTDNTTYQNDYEKPMVRLQDVYGALGGLKLVQISQSDYDNLQNKDASTLYIIT